MPLPSGISPSPASPGGRGLPRPSTDAVAEALRVCRSLGYTTGQGSAFEAYLAARRLGRRGMDLSIRSSNAVVAELFGLIPEDSTVADGRAYLFRKLWGPTESSGRSTVWNVTTRGHSSIARELFELWTDPTPPRRDFRAGLRPDAAAHLRSLLPKSEGMPVLPPWRALAAILLRAETLADDDAARAALRDLLGKAPTSTSASVPLTDDELNAISTSSHLSVPLLAASSDDEFEPANLPVDVLPEVATPLVAGEAVLSPRWDPVDDVVVDPRVERMLDLAVATYRAVLLVGPPGSGKNTLLKRLIARAQENPGLLGLATAPQTPLTRTPDESWTSFELIGGQAPVAEGLRYAPGAVLDAIQQDRWLLLDETNRADMDKIFGALLTWLSMDDVELGSLHPDGRTRIELGWVRDQANSVVKPLEGLATTDLVDRIEFKAGRDWRLLGTYNPQDAQRVFRFGVALSRRFAIVPIPPLNPQQFAELLSRRRNVDDAESAVSSTMADEIDPRVVRLYHAHYADPVTQLGPAVFLRMLDYVYTGLSRTTAGVGAGSDAVIVGQQENEVAAPEDVISAPGQPTEVEQSTSLSSIDSEGTAPATTAMLEQLLAEAYLIRAGKYLSTYEDQMLSALGSRVTDPSADSAGGRAAISDSEWLWVTQQRDFVG